MLAVYGGHQGNFSCPAGDVRSLLPWHKSVALLHVQSVRLINLRKVFPPSDFPFRSINPVRHRDCRFFKNKLRIQFISGTYEDKAFVSYLFIQGTEIKHLILRCLHDH